MYGHIDYTPWRILIKFIILKISCVFIYLIIFAHALYANTQSFLYNYDAVQVHQVIMFSLKIV